MLLSERESSTPSNARLRWHWRFDFEKDSSSNTSGPSTAAVSDTSDALTCNLAHLVASASPWRSFTTCNISRIHG